MIPMTTTTVAVPMSVPAFIAKLWHMVSDESCDDLIAWTNDGTSFVIKNQSRFCSELLPRYYKHNNMASFIRQLNKYGFHKVSSIESSSLRLDHGDSEFSHAFFLRGKPKSLELIKRKMTSASREIVDIKGDMAPVLQQLLFQVQELKDNHETFESKMSTMKRENDALWREHSILRQKYVKQHKMINQLVQFLISLVQQTRGLNMGRGRGAPIVLKDVHQIPLMAIEGKRKASPVICEIDSGVTEVAGPSAGAEKPLTSYLIDSPIDPSVAELVEPESPTVVGGVGAEEITGNSSDLFDAPIVWGDDSFPPLDSPQSQLSVCPQDVTPAIIVRGADPAPANFANAVPGTSKIITQTEINPEAEIDPLVAEEFPTASTFPSSGEPIKGAKRKLDNSSLVLSDPGSRQDIENHLDVMQTDLESLKDILQGLDTSGLMGIFSEQDPLGLNMSDGMSKQLVSQNPGFFDMSDFFVDDDEEVVPTSIDDTTINDTLLNTPQPTPNRSIEPNFLKNPKRIKKS